MGVYYNYVNFSRRERFSIDALGGALKVPGIGRGLTARAFGLLLIRGWQENAIGIGRWSEDSVAVVGDDSSPDWDDIRDGFKDVEANAIMLVFHFDGFDQLGEAARDDVGLFQQLCHLAVTRQALELESHMQAVFGEKYLRRYRDLCKESSEFRPKDVVNWDVSPL